jgi:tRNA(fMet)-specific endonuclease VapC
VLVVLDTDHLSILQQRSQPECGRLEARLAHHPPAEIAVSIISFQEQAQGWLSWIGKSKRDADILRGYARLWELLPEFHRMDVLPYVYDSQEKYNELVRMRVRIGTLDLRIAAIALANQATVLSRNVRDFAKVPGLVVQDWTR